MYSLKELDVDFYLDNKCHFCQKAKKMFEEGGVLKDFNIKDKEPLPNNVEGVPYFFSNKTKRSQLGCPKSIDSLVEKLNGKGTVNETLKDSKEAGDAVPGLLIAIGVIILIFGIYLFYTYKK